MKPITFTCRESVARTPEDIAGRILDVANWPDFKGYGPIPGIRAAAFQVRTPEVVGSRVRVVNTDGSTHVEEIAEWQPGHKLRLHMKEFSAPLSRLATGIEETWEFERTGDETRLVRTFRLHAKSALTRPVLWVMSLLLRKAVARHTRELRT